MAADLRCSFPACGNVFLLMLSVTGPLKSIHPGIVSWVRVSRLVYGNYGVLSYKLRV